MQQVFFILGRDPKLSSAEIYSILGGGQYRYKTIHISSEALVIEIGNQIDLLQTMKQLGGTVKVGQIIDYVGFDESEDRLEKVLSPDSLLDKYFFLKGGKTHFGISLYKLTENDTYVAQLENRLKELHLKIKENLSGKGIKAGFVQIKERYLSSVSVEKNRLLSHGAEIVFLVSDDGILIGKTSAVQEFSSFSFRDYYRPGKDKKSGIMPPKLARMMINISGIKNDGILLDPFCGSGTIVQEGILLGIKEITGTDVSGYAVADTMRNIDWIFNHYPSLDRKYFDLSVKKLDIKELEKSFPCGSVSAVVTEPYLGPPLHQKPQIDKIPGIFAGLEPLYLDAFTKFHKIIRKNGTVVIIFPAFEADGKIFLINLDDKLRKLGFERVKITPADDSVKPLVIGGRFSFLKREILKFVNT